MPKIRCKHYVQEKIVCGYPYFRKYQCTSEREKKCVGVVDFTKEVKNYAIKMTIIHCRQALIILGEFAKKFSN